MITHLSLWMRQPGLVYNISCQGTESDNGEELSFMCCRLKKSDSPIPTLATWKKFYHFKKISPLEKNFTTWKKFHHLKKYTHLKKFHHLKKILPLDFVNMLWSYENQIFVWGPKIERKNPPMWQNIGHWPIWGRWPKGKIFSHSRTVSC